MPATSASLASLSAVRLSVTLPLCAAALLASSTAVHAQSVFTAEYYTEKLDRYDASGTSEGVFASLPASGARFYGATVDSGGRVYVGANGGGGGFKGIRRFDASGNLLGSISLNLNGALAVGANDVLFAGNVGTGQITRYAPDGTSLGIFATAPTGVIGLGFDAVGDLFTVSGGADVHKFSPTGIDLGTFATGLTDAHGVAFTNAGDMLVTNGTSNNVLRYNALGQSLGAFATSANGLTDPYGIAVDVTGNIYVGNHSGGGNTSVRQFSPTGQDLGAFATGPSLSSVAAYRVVGSAAAPEPGSIALLALGLTSGLPAAYGVGMIARRRRRKAA